MKWEQEQAVKRAERELEAQRRQAEEVSVSKDDAAGGAGVLFCLSFLPPSLSAFTARLRSGRRKTRRRAPSACFSEDLRGKISVLFFLCTSVSPLFFFNTST